MTQHNKDAVSKTSGGVEECHIYSPTNLVFQSLGDLVRFFRAILCFSSSLFFSELAKSVQKARVQRREHGRDGKIGESRPKQRTYVSVLHGADVRSEAAVGGGGDALHALVLLVQVHGERGEGIELGETR